LQLRYGGASVV